MKAVLFQRPLEFTFFVDGETWKQGEPLNGKLKVKNHAAETTLNDLSVRLVFSKTKDVHAKKAENYTELEKFDFPGGVKLSQGADHEWVWSLPTGINAAVTEPNSSLFLFFGIGEDLTKFGHLQVQMHLHSLLSEFLTMLTIHHRFVLKGMKHQKGYTEIKLDPPDGRTFAAVESFVVSARFVEEKLELDFEIGVTRVDGDGGTVGLKKKKESIGFELSLPEYKLTNGRLNETHLESVIQAVYEKMGVGSALGIAGKV